MTRRTLSPLGSVTARRHRSLPADPNYTHIFDVAEHERDAESRFKYLAGIRATLDSLLGSPQDVHLLLQILDGQLSYKELARRTGLHPTTWMRRVRTVRRSLCDSTVLRDVAHKNIPQ